MNELINKDSEWIIHFMGSLDRLLDSFEHLTANYRPTLNGERFFTDKEVSARLKVSRRTLQDYRNEGRIAYIQLGGKILYRDTLIMEVWGKYNASHTVLDFFAQKRHRYVQIFGTIIDARQNVAMQVYQILAHSLLLSCFVS